MAAWAPASTGERIRSPRRRGSPASREGSGFTPLSIEYCLRVGGGSRRPPLFLIFPPAPPPDSSPAPASPWSAAPPRPGRRAGGGLPQILTRTPSRNDRGGVRSTGFL